MWYVETRNAGLYSSVRNEFPAPEELSNLIDSLKETGVKFRVYYTQYEYEGYYSRVSLINEDTLEELFVHDYTCFGHDGFAYWELEVYDDPQDPYTGKVIWTSK